MLCRINRVVLQTGYPFGYCKYEICTYYLVVVKRSFSRYKSVLRPNLVSFNYYYLSIWYHTGINMKMNNVQFYNNFNSSVLIFLFLFFAIYKAIFKFFFNLYFFIIFRNFIFFVLITYKVIFITYIFTYFGFFNTY
jgi:hypothetical protein